MRKISYTICVSEPESRKLIVEKQHELLREGKECSAPIGARRIFTDDAEYVFMPFEIFNIVYETEFRGRFINSLQFTDMKYIKLSVQAWYFLTERRAAGNILDEDL